MYFTQEDLKKILKYIQDTGIKDSQFVELTYPFTGDEYCPLIRDGKNYKTSIKNLFFNPDKLSISSEGTWVVNGVDTGIKADTPDATDTVAGKVKLGSGTVQAEAAQSPSAESGKTYPIQKNSSGQLVVNVPWQNTQGSDTKVTQNAVGSTNGAFNILLAQTAENTNAETGSVNKASGLTYNPLTKALSTEGAVTASGAITGSSIKKSGGTSSQILMADGSVTTFIQTGDIDALFS